MTKTRYISSCQGVAKPRPITLGLMLMVAASSFVPMRFAIGTTEDKSAVASHATSKHKSEPGEMIPPEIEGSAEEELRDPFWPIGYQPKCEKKDEEAKLLKDMQVKWPVLKARGKTRDAEGNYIAILEKIGMVEAGDIVQIKQGKVIYRWKINAVTETGISYTKLDAKPIK